MCSKNVVVSHNEEITATVVEQKIAEKDDLWFDRMEKHLYIKYSEEFITRVTALFGATSELGIATITGSSSIGYRLRMKSACAYDICRKNLPTYADLTTVPLNTLRFNLEKDFVTIHKLSHLYEYWCEEISRENVSIVEDSWLIRQPMIDKFKEHTT